MMGWLLKLLGGSLGPYIAGAVGALILALAATAQVQTLRLHHAKSDLATARQALTDPATHKTWQSEAKAALADLGTCHTNTATLQAALDAQNARVEALGAESQARVAQSQKQAQNARAVAESYRQSAAAVMRAKPGVDACQSADELIAESVR